MYDVITVGSSTIDCFVDTGDALFKNAKTVRGQSVVAVPFGSKIMVDNLRFLTGGGGTNTAVAFSRLGLKTAYIGKLGGSQSDLILDELKKEKVSLSFVVKGENTGFSVVLDAQGHDRTIITYKGSNNDLQFKELPLSKIKTKWFYMASMVGESYKTLLKLIEYADKNGIKVAFNPSSYIATQGYIRLKGILSATDLLVFNREEAGELLGKNYPTDTMMRKLKALVRGIVIVTDGKNGSYCYDGDLLYYLPGTADKKPIETTGAGDSFGSSFLAGLIKGKPLDYCMKMGQVNAESVIMAPGAKTNLLTFGKVQRLIPQLKSRVVTKKL
ncbi:MAG: carbohydrate kinase family protein [Candidatus Woesearchaeota archaeon]